MKTRAYELIPVPGMRRGEMPGMMDRDRVDIRTVNNTNRGKMSEDDGWGPCGYEDNQQY